MGLNGVVTRYRDESNSKERPLQPDGNFAMNTLDVELNLLRRFRACAEKALRGRITRLVLFGSRARREAHARSDWDVAVFLKNGASNKDTLELADAAYDLIVEMGQTIHPVALSEDGRGASPLLLNEIEADGVPIEGRESR